MAASIKRVSNSASSQELRGGLEQDGAVIVENILTAEQLTNLNSELAPYVSECAPGSPNATSQGMMDFLGHSTVRIDGLPAKSPTFLKIMLLPQLLETADHFLLPSCEDYLFNTGQLIQIGPGQSAQELHRDEEAWHEQTDVLPWPRQSLQIEAMFALTDFTSDNGATQVVPGSHLWPLEREANPEEIVRAEMKAGSALLYLGTTIHGGGANETIDQYRRGMFLGYVVGWLRTEENTFFTVPIDKVRLMPARVQELLGYKAHGAIGVANVGNPMVLLNR